MSSHVVPAAILAQASQCGLLQPLPSRMSSHVVGDLYFLRFQDATSTFDKLKVNEVLMRVTGTRLVIREPSQSCSTQDVYFVVETQDVVAGMQDEEPMLTQVCLEDALPRPPGNPYPDLKGWITLNAEGTLLEETMLPYYHYKYLVLEAVPFEQFEKSKKSMKSLQRSEEEAKSEEIARLNTFLPTSQFLRAVQDQTRAVEEEWKRASLEGVEDGRAVFRKLPDVTWDSDPDACEPLPYYLEKEVEQELEEWKTHVLAENTYLESTPEKRVADQRYHIRCKLWERYSSSKREFSVRPPPSECGGGGRGSGSC